MYLSYKVQKYKDTGATDQELKKIFWGRAFGFFKEHLTIYNIFVKYNKNVYNLNNFQSFFWI